MSIDLEEFDTPDSPDFQRANGAPMVLDKEGKRIRLSRPSNYAKPLDDESALTNWRIDTACFGVAGDKALQARYVAAKRDDRETVKALREASIQAGRGSEGADIGTALHAMSQRWEEHDPDFNPPEPFLSKLQAYDAEMARLGLVSSMFEFHTVCLEYGSAGTADRIYQTTKELISPKGDVLPVGTLLIGDLKTNKSLEYSLAAYSVQMALYAQGEFYDVVTDTFRPTPAINQDWGVLMWLPSQREDAHCEALWVDLQAGNYGCWLASEVKDWRKKWRNGTFAAPKIPDPMLDVEAIAAEFDAEVLEASVEDLAEWAKDRIAAIRDHPEARTKLMQQWPEGLPTPKQGITSQTDVAAVLRLLDKIERDFSLPFPGGDPRIQQGAHKSALQPSQGG